MNAEDDWSWSPKKLARLQNLEMNSLPKVIYKELEKRIERIESNIDYAKFEIQQQRIEELEKKIENLRVNGNWARDEIAELKEFYNGEWYFKASENKWYHVILNLEKQEIIIDGAIFSFGEERVRGATRKELIAEFVDNFKEIKGSFEDEGMETVTVFDDYLEKWEERLK